MPSYAFQTSVSIRWLTLAVLASLSFCAPNLPNSSERSNPSQSDPNRPSLDGEGVPEYDHPDDDRAATNPRPVTGPNLAEVRGESKRFGGNAKVTFKVYVDGVVFESKEQLNWVHIVKPDVKKNCSSTGTTAICTFAFDDIPKITGLKIETTVTKPAGGDFAKGKTQVWGWTKVDLRGDFGQIPIPSFSYSGVVDPATNTLYAYGGESPHADGVSVSNAGWEIKLSPTGAASVTPMTAAKAPPVSSHHAFWSSGQMLIFGGRGTTDIYGSSDNRYLYAFDPRTNNWHALGQNKFASDYGVQYYPYPSNNFFGYNGERLFQVAFSSGYTGETVISQQFLGIGGGVITWGDIAQSRLLSLGIEEKLAHSRLVWVNDAFYGLTNVPTNDKSNVIIKCSMVGDNCQFTKIAVNLPPAYEARTNGVLALPAGDKIVFFGGTGTNHDYLGDGFTYDTKTGKFSYLAGTNAEWLPRSNANGFWTGAYMVVFGGYQGNQYDGSVAKESFAIDIDSGSIQRLNDNADSPLAGIQTMIAGQAHGTTFIFGTYKPTDGSTAGATPALFRYNPLNE